MIAYLDIGGLVVAIEGAQGVDYAMLLPGMNVFVHDAAPSQLHITLDTMPPDMTECRWLHGFPLADGQLSCRFGRDAQSRYVYSFGDIVTLCADLGCEIPHFSISATTDASLLRFALWSAYSLGSIRYGRLPIHSSAVVCEGRAVLCLGESGTGKSTHTRLWIENIPGTHLLNDDSPILSADGTVYGSPWSGKTHCYLKQQWPVAAFLRLEQRPANSIRRLPVLQSFAALQPSCPPCLMKDEPLQDALVSFIGQVLGNCPVFHMGCLPNPDAAFLSHDTIFCPCK